MLRAAAQHRTQRDAAIVDAGAAGDRGAREPAAPALVGDISNSLAAVAAASRRGDAGAASFHELLGFNEPNPARWLRRGARRRSTRSRLTATFACQPGAARAVLGRRRSCSARFAPSSTRTRSAVTSVHLGESPEEVEFLRNGTGPWRSLLERSACGTTTGGAGCSGGLSRRSGFPRPARTLVVHGVQFDGTELDDCARSAPRS